MNNKRILFVQHADGRKEMICPNCGATRFEIDLEGRGGDDYQ